MHARPGAAPGSGLRALMKPYYQDDAVTIYHGDCREVETWREADVMVSDPPYGMNFQSSWTTEKRPIVGDGDASLRDEVLALWGNKAAAIFGTWRIARPIGTRQVVTWFKSSVGPGMGDLALPWGCATEEIYILGEGWHGSRRPNLVVTSEQRGNPYGSAALLGHPTPKPVGLIESLILCAAVGTIADPFAGSGSTLCAAKNLGRKAIGIEIEERYCEIAARRCAQEVLPL